MSGTKFQTTLSGSLPIELLGLLAGKDLMVGVIDVQDETVETPEEVAATIRSALKYVKPEHLIACTNCGLAPTPRPVALAKLHALVAGRGWLARRCRRGNRIVVRAELCGRQIGPGSWDSGRKCARRSRSDMSVFITDPYVWDIVI